MDTDLCVYLFHATVFPFGLQPQPRRGQRDSMAHCHRDGGADRQPLELAAGPRHFEQLQRSIPALPLRYDSTLAASAF